MLDHSSNSTERSPDHLSEMLRGLRLDGVDYSRCRLTAPWGIAWPSRQEARFYFVSHNGCWLKTPDGQWLELRDGDAVLLPRGGAHVLASAPDAPVAPPLECAARPLCDDIMDVEAGGGGEHTALFSGSMTFNIDPEHPLLRLMPDVMRMCEFAADEPGLPHLLAAMGREVALERVGAGGILARLADVLAASIIRAWVERGCGEAKGWVAAARCPQIGKVLTAIHGHPERDWNVKSLAALMGVSRSGFAERFAEVVGETPARYVTQVRMHVARQWLIRDKLRIALVAQRLGYKSEASFSRAFKRIIGTSPSEVRAVEPQRIGIFIAPAENAGGACISS